MGQIRSSNKVSAWKKYAVLPRNFYLMTCEAILDNDSEKMRVESVWSPVR